jgi:hypothetical protein
VPPDRQLQVMVVMILEAHNQGISQLQYFEWVAVSRSTNSSSVLSLRPQGSQLIAFCVCVQFIRVLQAGFTLSLDMLDTLDH